MKDNVVELLLVLQFISVCSAVNPCVDYVLMYMADGLRSSDFDSWNSDVSLCDAYLYPAPWYRFEHEAGNRLIEGPVEPWHCGTQAPIWMNGTHPTDNTEVTASVCATFSSENICGWSGTVRIRLCNESGSEYVVYQLAVPPGCPLAYCVDATTRKQCIPPEVWLDDEFRCGVLETTTEHSTVSQKTSTSSSTDRQSLTPTSRPSTEHLGSTTTSRPSTERQSLTTTSRPSTERLGSTTTFSTSSVPTSFGWSAWGPWSVCTKSCDYGFQSSRRTCGQLPCEGPANTYRVCNDYNCHSLPEEKTRGIGLVFQYSESKEDTMLEVVLNQPSIHDIIRKNIDNVCSQNVSMCCGSRFNSIGLSPLHREFVLSDNIYPAQGSIKPRRDNTVYYQVIANVNEDVDRAICKGQSQWIHARQTESNANVLSFDVMLWATIQSADSIFKRTGLVVTEYMDPATMIEDNNGEDNEVECPSLTCILPIVLCIIVIVLALTIGGLCFLRNKMELRTKPVFSFPEPPSYYNIKQTNSSVSCKGLPCNAIDISHNEYDMAIDQDSVGLDFQGEC